MNTSNVKPAALSPSCGDGGGDDESLGLILHFVRQGMIHHLERALVDHDLGLSFTQYRVIKALSHNPQVGASDLARHLEYDPGALTRLLDKMQERGYLQRHTSPEDRRAVEISLTDAGRGLVRPLREISDQVTAFAMSELTDNERTTLIDLLKRVHATLGRDFTC